MLGLLAPEGEPQKTKKRGAGPASPMKVGPAKDEEDKEDEMTGSEQSSSAEDEVGRQIIQGRTNSRDVSSGKARPALIPSSDRSCPCLVLLS